MLDADATIAALTSQPRRTAVLADYDGSLAPIVADPEAAGPLPEVVAVLGRLTAALGLVAVVSGRPVEFLRAQLPVEGIVLTGLYGMETVRDGIRYVDPRVEPYLGAIEDAAGELRGQFPPGVVEEKSGIAITLHWRPVPELAAEVVATGEALAARFGLGVYRSRMAFELRPPVPIDKGTAVTGLVRGFAAAAFAGDDTGDLPAFAALRTAGLDHACRIGVLSDEAPPELAAAVDLVVDGPHGLVALLSRVADEVA